jgi:outer membrane assembly lipoprotein YfiO
MKHSTYTIFAFLAFFTINAKLTDSKKDSYTPKGIFNPFIDNLLADEEHKSHMAIKDMRLDELYPKIEEYLKMGYLKYARAALERVITIEKNQTKLKSARLRLAQVYYDLEEYKEAQKAYTEFAELYPGSDKTEFAKYKAVDCGCKQITTCDRDQKSTRQAAEIAKDYLASDTCKQYRDETKALCELCYDRLLEHELYVAEFHISRSKYKSAAKRLSYARTHYLSEVPEAEQKIKKIEKQLNKISPGIMDEVSTAQSTNEKDSKDNDITLLSFMPEDNIAFAPGTEVENKKASFADRF